MHRFVPWARYVTHLCQVHLGFRDQNWSLKVDLLCGDSLDQEVTVESVDDAQEHRIAGLDPLVRRGRMAAAPRRSYIATKAANAF